MRVCFYFEYKNIVGGLTSLLITLIKTLHKKNIEVVLFNFKDGLIAEQLKKDSVKIKIIDIDSINWKQSHRLIRETDVFVITKFLEIFRHFFKANPKLIYYNINDELCNVSRYKMNFNFLAKKLIQKLNNSHSLLLMDDTGIKNALDYLHLKIEDPLFLPIPVAVPNQNIYVRQARQNIKAVRFTYVGRSQKWKILPLKKILKDLAEINSDIPVVFTIAVDNITELNKLINLKEYSQNNFLKIDVQENILPSQINDFLLQNADVNFGMGTTALESAKLGIPTILLDFSKRNFPKNYQYNWLHKSNFFSLGKNVEHNYIPSGDTFTMSELMQKISEDKTFSEKQSHKSYEYVLKHHSTEAIAASLIKYAEKAQFRFLDAKKYVLYYYPHHRMIKKIFKS